MILDRFSESHDASNQGLFVIFNAASIITTKRCARLADSSDATRDALAHIDHIARRMTRDTAR